MMDTISATTGRTPEQRLFVGILVNAITEAVAGTNTYAQYRDRVRDEAYDWIDTAGDDFQFICHAADLEPSAVRERALAYIAHARRHHLRKRGRVH